MTSKNKVDYNLVVSIKYTLKIDGVVIDSSTKRNTLDYLHGYNNIIPGLERELRGMALGENKIVVVAPQDGYGEFDPDAFTEVLLAEFPNSENLAVGTDIEMEDEDGVVMIATVNTIDDTLVKLDFNHPLAGKELHFDVTIVALRTATDVELEHGYVYHAHDEG